MSQCEELICSVQPNIYSDDIFVLIPPKLWDNPHIAEGIKKAVELTQKGAKDALPILSEDTSKEETPKN